MCGLVALNENATAQAARLRTATVPRPLNFSFVYDPLDADMHRMQKHRGIVEPALTRVWHELTWQCCRQENGLAIDVGGNYGWYALLSATIGCEVITFEPVPAHVAIMRKALSLNPKLAGRVQIHRAVVYDTQGVYNISVPVAMTTDEEPNGTLKTLGMTGMSGRYGVLKRNPNDAEPGGAYAVTAPSLRIDDVLAAADASHDGGRGRAPRPVCMLKVDVEGYEPQVMRTAKRTLDSGRVRAVQVEINRMYTRAGVRQNSHTVEMLDDLETRGFAMRQVPGCPFAARVGGPCVDAADAAIVDVGWKRWQEAPSFWNKLAPFPSNRSRLLSLQHRRAKSRERSIFVHFNETTRWAGPVSAMERAFRNDILSRSSNLAGIGPAHQRQKK